MMEGGDLRNAVAANVGEKHVILKQRDKIVRTALGLHMKKQTELSEAVDLRGACPDMCPEMERYIREDRNQLSVFERLADSDSSGPVQIDHRLAVKEYSRSSADQDLPLPHELRPGAVLQRTMHFLLNNIADRGGDGRWSDWFDFLWNRTRGIRKDITQQQLCDLTAVELVEKCARFHIYCGERLCEEDMMTFDEKINNENLTKCLQTLKEFYHDLAKKQIFCPNEAEFRSYMVLMNLNSGDILREVQQLRAELRQSPMIGFVVRVYSALNSNNFYRFFKLVRGGGGGGGGGFLSACIMHRYFYQVRIKAFHILTRAYNKKEPCPVGDLTRVLAFDSDAETLEFCQSHGLLTDGTYVTLDRAAFVEPETSYGPRRARVLIEGMQSVSVGETINGGPLPPNVIAEPQQVSFDAAGRYIGKDVDVMTSSQAPASQRAGRSTPEPQQNLFMKTEGARSQHGGAGRLTPEPQQNLFMKTEARNQRGAGRLTPEPQQVLFGKPVSESQDRRTSDPQKVPTQQPDVRVSGPVNLVYFDLETTGLARNSHITQLAVKCGEDSMSMYVMPKEPIAQAASAVTGIVVSGTTMYHHDNAVEAARITDALQSLLAFLSSRAPCVLVAQNVKSFDSRVLYHALENCSLLEVAKGFIRGFVDTLPYFKKRYPALPSYKQETLMKTFLGDTVQTHDALDDINALKKLVELEAVSEQDFLEHSFTFDSLVETMKCDKRKASFNPMSNEGALTAYMAQKLASSGIAIDDVIRAFQESGNDGVERLLTEGIQNEPRVTKNKQVIGRICEFLLKNGVTAGTQALRNTPSPVDVGRSSPHAPPTQIQVPNEIVKEIAKDLFIEVIREFTDTMSKQQVMAIHRYLDYDKPITAQFLGTELKQEIRSVVTSSLRDCEAEAEEEQARARAEYSMRKRRAEQCVADDICDQEVTSQIRLIAEEQCRTNEENLQRQSLKRCTEQEADSIIAQVLRDVTQEVADDVFARDVTERLEELAENARAVERMITARYFRRWKNQHAARIRLNKAMQTFPAAPSMLNARQQFEHLVPRSEGTNRRGVDLGNKRARVTLDSPLQLSVKRIKLEQHMALRDYWREIRREMAFAPLDVANIVHQQLKSSARQTRYTTAATAAAKMKMKNSALSSDCKTRFKLLVCTSDEASSSECVDWLTAKLTKGAVPNPPVHGLTRYLSLYSTRLDNSSIGVCVNAINGTPYHEQTMELRNTSFLHSVHALLFVVSSDVIKTQAWTREQNRLSTILNNLHSSSPPALAVLCPHARIRSVDLENDLDLQTHVTQGHIASFSVHVMKSPWDQPAASKTLLNALRSLVTHPRHHYVTERLVVRELVEHFLYKHFYSVVYEHQAKIPHANDWEAQDLVDLYNHVTEHVGKLVTAERTLKSEFTPDTCTEIANYFRDMLLPDVKAEENDGEQSAQQVYRYVQQTASEFSRSKAVLYNRISRVMDGWRRQRECDVFSEHCRPPWVQVIMACVEYRLSELTAKLQHHEEERGDELLVSVRREALQSFKPPPLPLNMEVQYAFQPPKTAAPVLTKARLERHNRESGHFDRITLRDVRGIGDVNSFGDVISHDLTRQSVASSLICNVSSMDATQLSVTSSQFVQKRKIPNLAGVAAAVVENSRVIPASPVSFHSRDNSTTTSCAAGDFTMQPPSPEKALNDMSVQYEWAISREKNKNKQFENYLKAMLNDECVSLDADTTTF